MFRMKWIGLMAVALLITACFLPWITVEGRDVFVSGVVSRGMPFGKPGYFHLLMAVFFLLFHFIPKVWAKRSNLLVAALNFAWAIRNYFLITACRGGECPDKHTGIYLVMAASLLMLIAALFPDIKLNQPVKKQE